MVETKLTAAAVYRSGCIVRRSGKVSLQKGTQTVTITDPHDGKQYEIKVTVDWNDEMTQACVFVDPETFRTMPTWQIRSEFLK